MTANQTLAALRKERGISQEALAETLDVSRQTISRWENGVSLPSAENLAKLSALFQVPIEALLKDGWVPPDEAVPAVQAAEAPFEVQEAQAPTEVPASVPPPAFPLKHRCLYALLSVLIMGTCILFGVLLFRDPCPKTIVIPSSELERSVIDDSVVKESITLLPPWETDP